MFSYLSGPTQRNERLGRKTGTKTSFYVASSHTLSARAFSVPIFIYLLVWRRLKYDVTCHATSEETKSMQDTSFKFVYSLGYSSLVWQVTLPTRFLSSKVFVGGKNFEIEKPQNSIWQCVVLVRNTRELCPIASYTRMHNENVWLVSDSTAIASVIEIAKSEEDALILNELFSWPLISDGREKEVRNYRYMQLYVACHIKYCVRFMCSPLNKTPVRLADRQHASNVSTFTLRLRQVW